MQQRHGDDERTEEPVGHVNVLHLALADGSEEHHRIRDPHGSDQDVDRPFQLGIFLAGGIAQRQADGRRYDDKLPAPKSERRQLGQKQPRLASALHHVIAGGEQAAAAECEDHGIGVQRTQPAIAQPWNAEVEFRPGQLGGDEHAYQHADHPPYDSHDRKLAYYGVVVVRNSCL